MLANFKKFGVAAAVASALGAAGAAQAFSLGDPADALLIPYVFAGANAKGVVTNTLVGLVVANPANVNLAQFADVSTNPVTLPGPGSQGSIGHGTLTPGSKFNSTTPWCAPGRLHWYFFNIDSQEVADGTIPVTCEDFVRIDWNYITDKSFPSAKGVPGYMVIGDDIGGSTRGGVSGLVLYGAAYQIRGNWGSQAYIPAVPLVDSVDGTAGDEVTHSGAFVTNVNPVTAGLSLPYATNLVNPAADQSWFSLRYFLDPALNGATTFVLWFPDTAYQTRLTQQVVVFDADEGPLSAATSAPHELNLIQVDPTADPKKPSAPHTAVLRDGLTHTNTDGSGVSAVGSAVNTGFVLFDVHDIHSSGSVVVDGNTIFEGASVFTPVELSRAGFAFSLIGIGGGSAPDQVQTELAHERGLK
jgi:hypothetical protein